MEWTIWITWWVMFCIRYSRLFWICLSRLFWICIKKHETVADNYSIRVYANKMENRITFKIKTGYYLKLLTPETMKLLGSIKNKTAKDKNGANVPYLQITEVVLVHCNIVNNDYQQHSRVLYTFAPNRSFGQFLNILRNLYFKKLLLRIFLYWSMVYGSKF